MPHLAAAYDFPTTIPFLITDFNSIINVTIRNKRLCYMLARSQRVINYPINLEILPLGTESESSSTDQKYFSRWSSIVRTLRYRSYGIWRLIARHWIVCHNSPNFPPSCSESEKKCIVLQHRQINWSNRALLMIL